MRWSTLSLVLLFAFILQSISSVGRAQSYYNDGSSPFDSRIVEIATGANFSMALGDDGSIWAWGENGYGQLGDGTIVNRRTPVRVKFNERARTIACGSYHTLIVDEAGNLWGWGQNDAGQLGDADGKPSPLPKKIRDIAGNQISNIIGIAAGVEHSLALTREGKILAFGGNSYGQLGRGVISETGQPLPVVGATYGGQLSHVVAIAAGQYHSMALLKDGSAWAWGNNASGQLGDFSQTDSPAPGRISDPSNGGAISNIKSISAGGNRSIVIKGDGTAWEWGERTLGAVDGGTFQSVPKEIYRGSDNFMGAARASLGRSHSIILRRDGRPLSWGRNLSGQLGDDSHAASAAPTLVSGVGGEGPPLDLISIAAGESHSLGLSRDGNIYAWGDNSFGQLGDGSPTDSESPRMVNMSAGAR